MSSLPTGTITFLLTDIEGSTRLWDQDAPSMQIAVVRHQQIISDLVSDNDGYLPKAQGEGDSVLAVFSRPSDAVAAALGIQRTLNTESWPASTPIGVRIAVHAGEAELREGDYYGSTVNRCARLRAIAHGGQILLSKVTAELVRDQLPEDASLDDLGTHRLRDLATPEHVFQLRHPELPTDFPQLRSIDQTNHNLPIQLTSFIGREAEIVEVKKLLSGTRLLTLTGPGGFGKTRLALEVASAVIDEFPDGAWVAELEYLSDQSLVAQALASELGVREEAGRDLIETITDYLRTRQLLLILDNCEHVIGACATLVSRLLPRCPSLKILATSREGLAIAGETTWTVPPLSLPDPQLSPTGLEGLAQYESVRLFVDRALLAKPDFTLSHDDAPALAAICWGLDGIPLAIELAASWVKVLPLQEINKRMGDRLRLLAGGARTAAARKQTIRASIDWSFDLLDTGEKVLFAQLSVFHGGFTLEAAEETCGSESNADEDILETLSYLVDKSLVLAEERGGAIRYRMLEVVRQYAAEKLAGSGAEKGLRDRHLEWFTSVAQRASEELEGPHQLEWLENLDDDHDNFRAALEWTATASASEMGLRLAGALGTFWFVRGHWTEGRRRLDNALSRCAGAPSGLRATGLYWAGGLALCQGDYGVAQSRFEEALELRRKIGDQFGIATVLNAFGNMATVRGDLVSAKSYFQESLPILRSIEDKPRLMMALSHLGYLAHGEGDFQAARSLLEEALSLAREVGGNRGIGGTLYFLGNLAEEEGDYPSALSTLQEALTINRALGDKARVALCLDLLGSIALEQGDLGQARPLIEEAHALSREIEDKQVLTRALRRLGLIAQAQQDYERAEGFFQKSLGTARELNDRKNETAALAARGNLARLVGKLPEAQKLLEESLRVAESSVGNEALTESLKALGDLHWTKNELRMAKSYYRKALRSSMKENRKPALPPLIERAGEVLTASGLFSQAAQVMGASSNARISKVWPAALEERARNEATLAAIRKALPPKEFERAWEEGAAMTSDEAAALVFELLADE